MTLFHAFLNMLPLKCEMFLWSRNRLEILLVQLQTLTDFVPFQLRGRNERPDLDLRLLTGRKKSGLFSVLQNVSKVSKSFQEKSGFKAGEFYCRPKTRNQANTFLRSFCNTQHVPAFNAWSLRVCRKKHLPASMLVITSWSKPRPPAGGGLYLLL